MKSTVFCEIDQLIKRTEMYGASEAMNDTNLKVTTECVYYNYN